MIVVYFCGGGTFIAICILVLLILNGSSALLCENIYAFISNNIPLISCIAIGLTVIGSFIGAYCTKKHKVSSFMGCFFIITQLLFCLVYGLYSIVATSLRDSYGSFLTLWSFIIYIVTFVIDAFVSVAITVWSTESNKTWPLIIAGIAGLLFNIMFW